MSSGFFSKVHSPALKVIDSAFEAFRQANREYLYSIWRKAQDGKLDGLNDEERQLAKIMLDHSDEYFNQFEFADVLADHEFDPKSEGNPFVHVALHALLENQLKDHEPIEALQFYNAMLKNRCSAHEAIHLLMAILLKFLFPVFKKRGRFDLNGYRKLLRIYKLRKPDKILALLESEPEPSEPEEEDHQGFQVFDEMRAAMEDQTFHSIEEAQAFASAWLEKKNREPLSEFLGLSPEQMNRILYRPFQETSDIVTLSRNLSGEKMREVPVVKETIYFLRRLGELQPLKATAKGNLPRAFACEMNDQFPEEAYYSFSIRSEQDNMKLLSLRHILDMCGWIKKRDQKFYLTRKGQILNEKGFGSDDFHHLFQTYIRKFNWRFRDLYSELGIIQQAFLFSCYLLHRKARNAIKAKELSNYFIQAFPAVLRKEKNYKFFEDPNVLIGRAFYVRFVERFCEYFGLVTIERPEKMSMDLNDIVRTTPFFDELFQWKL